MSWKSLLLSIFAIVFMSGFLYLIIFLFGIDIIFGIIGIVVWLVVPSVLMAKANALARGVLDRVFARYIAPIISAVLLFGTICYIIYLFTK